jgi:hypothetical protein
MGEAKQRKQRIETGNKFRGAQMQTEQVPQTMLPQPVPPGASLAGAILPRVLPSPNVVFFPAEAIREVNGIQQYRDSPLADWSVVPSGAIAHPIDAPLPPELCVLAFDLVSVVQSQAPALITAPGEQPRPTRKITGLTTLWAGNLAEWIAKQE